MVEVLAYLQEVQGEHVTAHTIKTYMEEKGVNIGTTTIYRHLERLVAQGVVAKHLIDGTSAACFEYIGEHEKQSFSTCFHCKCEKCGELIHLQCEEVSKLEQHMAKHHGFQMNPKRMIFYGTCEKCK